MSLEGELRAEIIKIRQDLLAQMSDARSIDDKIKAALEDTSQAAEALKLAMHSQTSLKNAINITLDSLERIDLRLAKPPRK